MNNGTQLHGVVVPMVTPVTETGSLDEPAIERLVDFLLSGSVDGIFVLGTTGEGVSVPAPSSRRIVELTVARVQGRAKVYAGIGHSRSDNVAVANEYFRAGADAAVARPPADFPEAELLSWFQALLDGLSGPLILYNIPAVTSVSIPLDLVSKVLGHPNLAGIKDSENNRARLEELMRRFGGLTEFSIFVGVGALMARGLELGAQGIVPSVGNLIPDVCRRLCASAAHRDWAAANGHATRMNAVAALYQNGRTIGQSLAALKAALACRGLCRPHVLPPLVPLGEPEINVLREKMTELRLL